MTRLPPKKRAADILANVDPLRSETLANLFYYAAAELVNIAAARRGIAAFAVAVAVYQDGRHGFLFDGEAGRLIDLEGLNAALARLGEKPTTPEGPGVYIGVNFYAGTFGYYLRRRDAVIAALTAAVNVIKTPAFIYDFREGVIQANDALTDSGFPLPPDFRDALYRDFADRLGEIIRPDAIRVPGDLILMATGRAPALAVRSKKYGPRLNPRGKHGLKNPDYQAARAADLPLVTPEISDAGLVMLFYEIAYTGLIMKGEAGVYEGGDWLYASKGELYEIIGANLDYRTRRKGLVDLTRGRERIAGYLAGRYVEYKTHGGMLTKILHVDRDEVRFKGDKKYVGFLWQPLYSGLIREALTRATGAGIKGGVIYMPTARLDALLTEAQKVGDKNYAGLALGFFDVLRNRKKPSYTRDLRTLLALLKMASYAGESQGLPRARDAVRAKLDIYGAAGIVAAYDLQGDQIKITPHPALGAGEKGDLFDADEGAETGILDI